MKNIIKKLLWTFELVIMYLFSTALFTNNISEESIFTGLISTCISIILAFIIWKSLNTAKIDPKNPIVFNTNIQKSIYYLIGLLYIIFIFVINGVFDGFSAMTHISILKNVNYFLIAVSAGVFEEFICRGLLFNIFYNANMNKKMRLLPASIYSSLIFAFLHFTNYFTGQQNLNATLQQIVFALMMGVLLSYIRIITDGLWLPIVVHTIIDFNPGITRGDEATDWSSVIILSLLVIIPLAILIAHLNTQKKEHDKTVSVFKD